MKTFVTTASFLLLAACGSLATSVPALPTRPEVNPAIQKAAAAADPNAPAGLDRWPTSGVIRCHVGQEPNFAADYEVRPTSTERVVSVTYTDAWMGQQTYTAVERYDVLAAADFYAARNRDYGSVWGWTDLADGRTRGWGFALDISTLTLYANAAVAPGSDRSVSGWLAGYDSTDCAYTAE